MVSSLQEPCEEGSAVKVVYAGRGKCVLTA